MGATLLVAMVSTGGLASGLSAPAHGDSNALVNIEVADNQLVLLSGITVAVAANVCGVQANAIQASVVDSGHNVDCDAMSQQRGQRTVIRRQGSAASAPNLAHRQGGLVNVEVEDNQVVLLSGITIAVAANVCGVTIDAVQSSVIDSGQDVDCRSMTQQRQQRTIIRQTRR